MASKALHHFGPTYPGTGDTIELAFLSVLVASSPPFLATEENATEFAANFCDVMEWNILYGITSLLKSRAPVEADIAYSCALLACLEEDLEHARRQGGERSRLYGVITSCKRGIELLIEVARSGGTPKQLAEVEARIRWLGSAGMKLVDGFLIMDKVASMLRHRTLFVTKNGFLGLGPESMESDDEVWLVAGLSCPAILRPVAGPNVQYILVGTAFVHGIMNGELMTEEAKLEFGHVEIV
jgi:hypothetical protein